MKIEDGFIKFKLNPDFYSEASIKSTIFAFKELCFVAFDGNNNEVCLKPKKNCDIEELGLEFCNYCLGLMK